MAGVQGILLMRVKPKIFSDTMKSLSSEQKQWVNDTGFGSLLNFGMEENYPRRFGNFLVSSFDHVSSTMTVGENIFNITDEEVHKVLGLPMGPNPVEFVRNTGSRNIWTTQFQRFAGVKVTASMIKDSIISSPLLNMNFKRNFLVLMSNTFISSSTNPYVKQELLDFAGNVDLCSDYNWCGYLITSLQRASIAWSEVHRPIFYTGPIVFLIYFYLDQVVRDDNTDNDSIPRFIHWKDSDIIHQESICEVIALTDGINIT